MNDIVEQFQSRKALRFHYSRKFLLQRLIDLACRSLWTWLCVFNKAMLSFSSSVIPTLVCSQNPSEKTQLKSRLYSHINTRWRRVFCSGSSVCRTRCWLAAALALSPRSPAASAPAAAGSSPPSAPESGSGSTATQDKKWAEWCQIIVVFIQLPCSRRPPFTSVWKCSKRRTRSRRRAALGV